jgi:hypothetical protein
MFLQKETYSTCPGFLYLGHRLTCWLNGGWLGVLTMLFHAELSKTRSFRWFGRSGRYSGSSCVNDILLYDGRARRMVKALGNGQVGHCVNS